MKKCLGVLLALLFVTTAVAPALAETVLEKIGRTGVLTAGTRIPLVANRTIDVECGSTTYTRGRDETVDFSINFFFTGSQLLVKKGSGVKSLADVAGKRVGAAQGTTNEKD